MNFDVSVDGRLQELLRLARTLSDFSGAERAATSLA